LTFILSIFADILEIMIIVKTKEEIELMRQAALVVSKTLGEVAKAVKPGVTSLQLDKIAEEHIRDLGAIPGFFRFI